MQDLIAQRSGLGLGQVRDGLEFSWVARNQSAFLQLGENVGQVVLGSELVHIAKHFLRGQVGQRVLDPVIGLVFAKCQAGLVQACIPMGTEDVLGGDVAIQVHILVVGLFFEAVTRAALNERGLRVLLGTD